MIRDENEIKEALKLSKEILQSRPELDNLSEDEILDELNDGTNEMVFIRWAVTARSIINSIKIWETSNIIKFLSEVEGKDLTLEFTGYILQNECNIDLEKLLIESEEYGCFDKILPYVSSNVKYIKDSSHIADILKLLDKHCGVRQYNSVIYNYAEAINTNKDFINAEKQIDILSTETQYKFMCNICRFWFEFDKTSAESTITRFIKMNTTWSNQAAIYYLNVGIDYEFLIFERHFNNIKILTKDDNLWSTAISGFCKYIDIAQNKKDCLIYKNTLEHLRSIPFGNAESKNSYLCALIFMESICEELKSILNQILSNSFDRDKNVLSSIDSYIIHRLKNEKVEFIIDLLLKVYDANDYGSDYSSFFNVIDNTVSILSKSTETITELALSYMLKNDINTIFFGLGLLLNCGDLIKLKEHKKQKFLSLYSQKELIRLMKTIVLFSIEDTKICKLAFQLMEFSIEPLDEYIEFCIKEVFYNYPINMSKIAETYLTSKLKDQVLLSNRIIELNKTRTEDHENAFEIKDLRPSIEHKLIWLKARQKRQNEISKESEARSFFADLFSKVHMKYGSKIGYIRTGIDNEREYVISSPATIEYTMEMPNLYISNPVEYQSKRMKFLDEVAQNEINS